MSNISKIIKSSGILNNFNFQAFLVDVEVANLDPDDDRKALVKIFSWNNNIPTLLPVLSFNGPNLTEGNGGAITIKESTTCSFVAFTTGVFAYEVRVTLFNTSENVVVTSQGIELSGNNVVGQTVLDKDFKTVDLD
ncbi:hypothetical protein [Paenibacillus sp. Soil750]|uniref:hypothetical protein n=1 Tax=Paenibacillus sp. Soil750 TaxID=1736398 RepID=UPI0006F99BA0|nr:hypothetical protein [Paenibacillus sp. Soil750]KRE55934.1 hypothetical protein ASL11_34950 [Paenibacillus sp. Soil750]